MTSPEATSEQTGSAHSAGIEGFWAVVPAGGAGTRLWPLSRSGAPKFLHDLTGSGRTLLQQTRDRLAPLAGDRVMVVTGQAHQDAVREQLPEIAVDNVLAEPSPRDSMAAIGWAAAVLERQGAEVMGSFAADHVISDDSAFSAAVRSAVQAARGGWLATIGIEPTFASAAFGYVRHGDPLPGLDGVRSVIGFVEKPSVQVASTYLASGDYRWNAGMFVVRPGVLLDLLAEQDPRFALALRELAAEPDSLAERWPSLPKIAIDHAVAEPAAADGRVATVPGGFGWDDVGDFDSLAGLLGERAALTVLGEESRVRSSDATGLVVTGSDRLVAVVGIDDVVVVDTEDALLVTTRERAQEVKAIVAALEAEGRDDLT
ncbi:mannose-1-phosphate guanylyltransferase [Nocardioides sambongensis]|uniref:mannose-1-phosphate guanylyltransferase n=1 Tax=Nocardioides sambongensis TaxID=2589074 RepID=UPI001128376D|nr:mannose-1-phosphate guanylyltransferase [Nocardioides sambongensis]